MNQVFPEQICHLLNFRITEMSNQKAAPRSRVALTVQVPKVFPKNLSKNCQVQVFCCPTFSIVSFLESLLLIGLFFVCFSSDREVGSDGEGVNGFSIRGCFRGIEFF